MRIEGCLATVLVLELGLGLGLGCQPDTGCPDNGSPCGGDPTGSWKVVDACRDPAFAAPVPATYYQQPVQIARQPAPMTSSSDWCSGLVLGTAMGNTVVTSFSFPHDTLGVKGVEITYTGDDSQHNQGAYEAVIDTVGQGAIELSTACLSRMGMSVSCDVVASALTSFAGTKQGDPGIACSDSPSEPAVCQFFFSYQNITCAASAGGACHCTYGVSFSGTPKGRWSRVGTLLTHNDASRTLPSQADYCAQGQGSLSLWGHDRTSILNQPGLRTLSLQRSP